MFYLIVMLYENGKVTIYNNEVFDDKFSAESTFEYISKGDSITTIRLVEVDIYGLNLVREK